MIAAVITGPTFDDACRQIALVQGKVSCVEFRLDLWDFCDQERYFALKRLHAGPVIVTLRKPSQGGGFLGDEKERLARLMDAASLLPDYIDIEHDAPFTFFQQMREQFPGIQLICSYHNFCETPEDLVALYGSIKHPLASITKLVCLAKTSVDSLRVLAFLQSLKKSQERIIAFCMGEEGSFSRVLAPFYGSFLTYTFAPRGKAAAAGQIALDAMLDTYRMARFNAALRPIALIGDPVEQSPSHITHNSVIEELGMNAVYVKFRLEKSEVRPFLQIAKQLRFLGASVTMPLKEEVAKHVANGQDMPVNTLCLTDNGWQGDNTDGKGALDAIEEKIVVKGIRIVIIGAGGTAQAIGKEAAARGASVLFINRTEQRAAAAAKEIGGGFSSVEDAKPLVSRGYEVIVNTVPWDRLQPSASFPFPEFLIAGSYAMDVNYTPKETAFLAAAKKKGCSLIFGMDMFVRQAAKQFLIWREESSSSQEESIRELLTNALSLTVYG